LAFTRPLWLEGPLCDNTVNASPRSWDMCSERADFDAEARAH
jgi:hypothetical protein